MDSLSVCPALTYDSWPIEARFTACTGSMGVLTLQKQEISVVFLVVERK
jgi:hypothetical protein